MTIPSSTIWALFPAVMTALIALEPTSATGFQGGSKDKDKKKDAVTAPVPVLDPWRGKFDEAKASAKERNVPILVHVILEDEETSDQYRDTILKDADLVKRSASALVIIANNGKHERKQIEVVVDGALTKRDVCSAYPMLGKCEEHNATWDDIYAAFRDEAGDLGCPQTIVLGPDAEISGRIDTRSTPQAGEIGALIVTAIAKAGPGLSIDEFERVQRGLELGRKSAAEKEWIAAWKAWSGVLAITEKSKFADEARAEEPKALAAMQAEFERISAGLVPGTAAKAFEELTAFGEAAAGTPLEKDVALRLKKAEGDKAIREELKAWRLAQEADALLREATDLTDAGDTKKAEKIVRKLLGTKYAGTPAQATARKLWPELGRG